MTFQTSSTGGRKIIVYSQWTRTFELLSPKLSKANIKYLEFSGRNTASRNDANKNAFIGDDVHHVLLLSTMSGGVALNLQRASYGLRTDKMYNNFMDYQAEDRMHRMGQTDTVIINDYIVQNSIEQDIEESTRAKKEEFDFVLDMKQVLEILRNR